LNIGILFTQKNKLGQIDILPIAARFSKRINTKMTMIKIDPIIAVKDVEASSGWYQQVFGFKRVHGGKDRFAVLVSKDDEILLCLHKWEEHHHPTMANPGITPGNGLILYFRTENMDTVRQNVDKIGSTVEVDIHVSPNSLKKEFSMRDPDGYYLTITEFHKYEG
jgi:predicted enzyme related to lactoylglutathione lyase